MLRTHLWVQLGRSLFPALNPVSLHPSSCPRSKTLPLCRENCTFCSELVETVAFIFILEGQGCSSLNRLGMLALSMVVSPVNLTLLSCSFLYNLLSYSCHQHAVNAGPQLCAQEDETVLLCVFSISSNPSRFVSEVGLLTPCSLRFQILNRYPQEGNTLVIPRKGVCRKYLGVFSLSEGKDLGSWADWVRCQVTECLLHFARKPRLVALFLWCSFVILGTFCRFSEIPTEANEMLP